MAKPKQTDKHIHKLLLLGAIEAELAPLVSMLQEHDFLGLEGQKKRNSEPAETELRLQTALCGVGSLQAALFLENYLHQNPPPDEILFLGSAGAYQKDSGLVSTFVLSHHFFQYDAFVLEGKAKVPDLLPSRLSCLRGFVFQSLESFIDASAHKTPGRERADSGKKNRIQKSAVNTTSSVTLRELCMAVKIQDRNQNLLVENLEAFGLAFVAHRRQIPFSSLLAITNLVSEKGSQEWQKNFVQLGSELCSFLASHLQAMVLRV